MPDPSSSSSTSAFSASGNSNLDALLNENFLKWGGSLGSGVTLSFSFPTVFGHTAYWSSDYLYGEPFATNCQAFNFTQANGTRAALQAWTNVANISFVEVAENTTNVGDLRFAFSSAVTPDAWGWSFYPNSSRANSGDVWVNPSNYNSYNDWYPGGYDNFALMHEIGHCLGLKHPGDYGGGEVGPFLPASLDVSNYSVMSYNDPTNNNALGDRVYAKTPMVYDILAIQYLYGANTSYHTGNDTYAFQPFLPFYQTIWDAGGVDTIDASSYSLGCRIDLHPGSYSTLAIDYQLISPFPSLRPLGGGGWYDGVNALGIAFGAVIENAIGGSGNDILYGNDAANVLNGAAGGDSLSGGMGDDTLYGGAGCDNLSGGPGNDFLDGGADRDAGLYLGNRSDFSITRTDDGYSVSQVSSSNLTVPEGTDTLVNIERLMFLDSHVALDLDGNAGMTAKILGAVFGAASVANESYAGIGLNYLDIGMSYAALGELAVASAGATTPSAVVNLLWSNVVGSPIDPASEAYYTGLLAGGAMTTGALIVLVADTAQNAANIGLVGLAATGMDYISAV